LALAVVIVIAALFVYGKFIDPVSHGKATESNARGAESRSP
jgi:hypothetical protein